MVVIVCLYYGFWWHKEKKLIQNIPEKYVVIPDCDSGFGNLLAKHLDLQGLQVLASCLTVKGAEVSKKSTLDRLKTVILDTTKIESLWGLVNNAGITSPTFPNEWLKKKDFVKILDVNLIGLIEVTLSMLPMVQKAQGRVVNVPSIAGKQSIFDGRRCISKYGVEAFSKIALFGVRVVIIEPGNSRTNIFSLENMNDRLKNQWSQVPLEIKEAYGEHYCKYANYFLSTGKKNLYPVIWSMEHALTAVHPRTHYTYFSPFNKLLNWSLISVLLSFFGITFILFRIYFKPKPAHAVSLG
uniref:Uncharacterized protein n=1 Tax=Sarcophilus harrisii TaxID=9305 RepID=A0A7N4PN98_SARHA